MVDFIQGKVVELSPTDVVVAGGSFGYRVQISLFTYDEIKGKDEVKLYTHLHVKNEGQNLSGFDLYGFATEVERTYFTTILSVSGIGTATARLMLSAFQPADIERAILMEDVSTITTVKGLGPKTAKRMILELKDKLPKTGEQSSLSDDLIPKTNNTIENEALSALVMLGFGKSQSQKVIKTIIQQSSVSSTEELIKLCLKKL